MEPAKHKALQAPSSVQSVSHRWPTVWTHHVYRTEGGCYRTECWSYCTEGGRATVHIFTYGESVLSRGNTLYSVLISLKGPLDLLVGPLVLVVCSALAVRCLGLAVRRWVCLVVQNKLSIYGQLVPPTIA